MSGKYANIRFGDEAFITENCSALLEHIQNGYRNLTAGKTNDKVLSNAIAQAEERFQRECMSRSVCKPEYQNSFSQSTEGGNVILSCGSESGGKRSTGSDILDEELSLTKYASRLTTQPRKPSGGSQKMEDVHSASTKSFPSKAAQVNFDNNNTQGKSEKVDLVEKLAQLNKANNSALQSSGVNASPAFSPAGKGDGLFSQDEVKYMRLAGGSVVALIVLFLLYKMFFGQSSPAIPAPMPMPMPMPPMQQMPMGYGMPMRWM